jgi:hypothetical protein
MASRPYPFLVTRKISDLRKASDDDLIREHDKLARHTHVGTAYYLDELDRRERNRAMKVTEDLARGAYRLTWSNTVLAAVAAVAAIIALFK